MARVVTWKQRTRIRNNAAPQSEWALAKARRYVPVTLSFCAIHSGKKKGDLVASFFSVLPKDPNRQPCTACILKQPIEHGVCHDNRVTRKRIAPYWGRLTAVMYSAGGDVGSRKVGLPSLGKGVGKSSLFAAKTKTCYTTTWAV